MRGETRPLSAAPMMDRTDRHFRYFLRRISRRTLLYTEMVTTGALLDGRRRDLLEFDPTERPIALQLGGEDPAKLAECARLAVETGYDEVNLNVGCPSPRVRQGRIGACLMAEPARVAEAVAAMRAAVKVPVTVKHRIGIDHEDRYENLLAFVDTVAEADCDRFIVHARKAWLTGLSPKQNREIPPLRYEDVYRLKRERPELTVELNGGVRSLEDVLRHLGQVDGVMIGRAAYDDPFLFAGADVVVFGERRTPPSRREVLEEVIRYAERRTAEGVPLQRMTRGLLGLFLGCRGSRAFRRLLSENAWRRDATPELLRRAMASVDEEALDGRPAPRSGAKIAGL